MAEHGRIQNDEKKIINPSRTVRFSSPKDPVSILSSTTIEFSSSLSLNYAFFKVYISRPDRDADDRLRLAANGFSVSRIVEEASTTVNGKLSPNNSCYSWDRLSA